MNKFRDITAHQGPLTSRDPNYKGSKFNVLIEWEDGDTTYEPLDVIAADALSPVLYMPNVIIYSIRQVGDVLRELQEKTLN